MTAVAGIIVFILTQDMSQRMVFADRWTILNAAIFAVEIVAVIFSLKKKKDSDDEDEEADIEPIKI